MRTDVLIKEGERVDDLHRKGYVIIQDPKRFCFGVDAVILSGFARVKKGEKVLDLGTGTGILPILLEGRTLGSHFTGLEIQPESVEMARRSVALNELEEKVEIVEGDIKETAAIFGGSVFDVVTSNPPYMNEGGGLQNPSGPKAIARHEVLCTLEDVVKGAAKVLRPGGRFYMVHRPHRLTDIICTLRQYGLEPKRLRLVCRRAGDAPSLLLLEARRGGRPGLDIAAPLCLEDGTGRPTAELDNAYFRTKETNA